MAAATPASTPTASAVPAVSIAPLAPSSWPAVPPRVQGLWRRTLLAVPARQAPSRCDTTTRVYWLQTPVWHGDIRVPADRPDFAGVRSLADCSEAQLRWLLTQQGFAGVTQVEADTCRWHRRIDHALSPTRDIGRLVVDDLGLQEWGVEADYYERWVPVDGAGPEAPGVAVGRGWQGDARADGGLRRCTLSSGRHAIHLRERPLADGPARAVRQAVAAGEPVERPLLEAAADFEISLAEQTADGWRIGLSTLPWREGARLQAEWDDPALPTQRWAREA